MSGFLKAILISIITVAAIIVFVNMAFFFPWYMEIVQTTFKVSQIISTDNYLAYDCYEDILNELKEKPIFREMADDVIIEAIHQGGNMKPAIELSGPHDVSTYYYPMSDETAKPYVQMGNMVTVTISAVYPFRMEMFGKKVTAAPIPVSFRMTTTTTRHYKDLEYDYGWSGHTIDEYDY